MPHVTEKMLGHELGELWPCIINTTGCRNRKMRMSCMLIKFSGTLNSSVNSSGFKPLFNGLTTISRRMSKYWFRESVFFRKLYKAVRLFVTNQKPLFGH